MREDVGNTRVKMGVMAKILLIALGPLLALAMIGTLFSAKIIRQGMEEEAIKRLQDIVNGVEQTLNAIDEGDFRLEGEILYKGEENLLERLPYFDAFAQESGIDLTLFFGDIRRITTLTDQNTNERILGTQAAEYVRNLVLEQGMSFIDKDFELYGEEYFCCYVPLEEADGTIVGMIFAGEPSSGIRKFIYAEILKVVLLCIGVILICVIFIVCFSRNLSKAVQSAENVIEQLATGNMDVAVESKLQARRDELGKIGKALDYLITEISKILRYIQRSSGDLMNSGQSLDEMAERVNVNAAEMGKAVEEISLGATSQAEEIEHASGQIMEMGAMIEQIVGGVDKLHAASIDMKQAGDTSAEIMRNLADSIHRTDDAVHKIGEQIYATNDSAQKIREAVDFISSIASQTSLLSLNASIEAARAGEFGKGFAVVASEIQKLADESSSSAQTIADIIASLIAESNMTVKIMQEVEEIIADQRQKLETTQRGFAELEEGIIKTREDTAMIEEKTKICDASRKNVMDVIANLSALSEENAASAQETTASMQELGATINLLAEAADSLMELSSQMDEQMKFFQL